MHRPGIGQDKDGERGKGLDGTAKDGYQVHSANIIFELRSVIRVRGSERATVCSGEHR